MIVTPRGFVPLFTPESHPAPLTFVFRGPQLLVHAADLALPRPEVLAALAIPEDRTLPVGRYHDAYVRATSVDAQVQAPAGHEFKGLRSLFGHVDDEMLAIAGRAFQVAEWARTHRFCGTCGRPTQKAPGERAMRCECGHVTYPRIAPAMMVLVKRGPAILLARNAAVAPGGRMSALAGFLDPGESVEDAVHREVMEEVGLEVKDLRYFGSQSWPFPGSLMIAFTAEYAAGEIACDPNEIAEARFFGPGDKLPDLPPAQSISRALIDANLPG
ncbi:MAG TPA: NAD(+) diphosphatase [Usitatibacter sp.]|nr:NAD(+) diphosphatase [Usitatibacter sp.]